MTKDKFQLLCSNAIDSFKIKQTTNNSRLVSLLLKYGLCKTVKKRGNSLLVMTKPIIFELKTYHSFALKKDNSFDFS
jgi:hypothetical protein